MNGIVAASVAPTVGPLDGVGARVGMSDDATGFAARSRSGPPSETRAAPTLIAASTTSAEAATVVRTRSVSRDAAVAPEGTGSQPAVYERWKDARLVPTKRRQAN